MIAAFNKPKFTSYSANDKYDLFLSCFRYRRLNMNVWLRARVRMCGVFARAAALAGQPQGACTRDVTAGCRDPPV